MPRWLQTAIPNLKDAPALHVQETQATLSARRGTLLDVKAKVVCASCNNGWMSDLEEGVRPLLPKMIRGREMSLSKAKQAALATWSVKTVLMFQYTHRQHDQVAIPREDYSALFQERKPSDIMRVWAAYMAPSASDNIDHYVEFLRIPMSATVMAGGADEMQKLVAGSYVGTLRIGHFVTQVVRIGLPQMSINVRPSVGLSRFIVQLWPNGGRPKWPPSSLAQMGGFARFADLLAASS